MANKRFPRGTPNSHEENLAFETAQKFNDLKSLRFYRKCFKNFPWEAKFAKDKAEGWIKDGLARNPGALFTHFFKKAAKNF